MFLVERYVTDTRDGARSAVAVMGVTSLGPLDNPAQRDLVAELLADAVGHGATVGAGGHAVDGPASSSSPRSSRTWPTAYALVDEEQFGAVLPVIGFTDEDDAVVCANATKFGLGSSVWSGDPEGAAAVADRLEAGMTWVNKHGATALDQPFAGTKWSGSGIENGRLALEGFTELQVLHHTR